MTNPDCEVCRGRRTITLPIYRSVSLLALQVEPTATTIAENSRTYPCPECADVVPVENVFTLRKVDERVPEEVMREQAAHYLVAELLRGDFIKTERFKRAGSPMVHVVSSVAVVSKTQRKAIEERIAERQHEVAQAVAQEAKAQICNWGSYYGRAVVSKPDACSSVDDALRLVLQRWTESKAEAACAVEQRR